MESKTIEARMKLLPLALPIFFDLMLKTLFNSIDIFMISHYSHRAVAGVGTASQVIFFMTMLYFVVGQGSGIAISQNLGAKRSHRAEKTAAIALISNYIFGMIASLIFIMYGKNIIGLFNMESDVAAFATDFISIVMGLSFNFAGSIVVGSILRNYGYTRAVMIINIGTNVLNIIGNILVLYGPFGIPVLGVTGVAISTVTAQGLGFVANMIYLQKKVPIFRVFRSLARTGITEIKGILRDILVIGAPSAGEYMSYTLCQICITWMIVNHMGTAAQTARIFAGTVIGYLILANSSIATASSIMVSFNIGAGRREKAFRLAVRNLIIAQVVSVSLAIILSVFRARVIGIFTDDSWIITTASTLLLFNIIIEPGRCFNMVIGNSLRGAGDVKFILLLGLSIQWTVLLGGAYFFGVAMGMGLIGVWLAQSIDEWTRGIIMILRWRSRKWESKSLVPRVETIGQSETDAELALESVTDSINRM
ncbi:MAG TPA: MATE family efflux transporter [Spirochaetota bacterium]